MKKLLALLFLFPFVSSAQKDYSSLLDKYMQAQVSVNEFAGTILVAQKGKIIYEKAFGLADRELNVPNTIQTRFQIGSITKQFTASCILQLVDEGKLSLDDKLSKYFTDFPKADSVTIHMLLSHTSGIKSYTDLQEFWKIMTVPIEKDSMVALIKRQPYNFPPGSKFSYNNSGYFLLGYIIEKVTGKSYSEYVLKNVIQKAGLKSTCVNQWDTILANRAKGYSKTPGGWKNAMYISMEGPYSAGAIISTIEDLYQWDNALFSGKIIPPALFTRMTTPNLEHYGYGLGIDTFQQHLRIGHGGGIPGFVSYLGRFPADDIVVAGLSNNSNNTDGIINALAGIMFGFPVSEPRKHVEVAIDSKLLDRYAGVYQQQNAAGTDSLIVKEGKLYWHPWWHGEFQMKAESTTMFFFEDLPDIQFEFESGNNGKAIKAYTIEYGIKKEIKKL